MGAPDLFYQAATLALDALGPRLATNSASPMTDGQALEEAEERWGPYGVAYHARGLCHVGKVNGPRPKVLGVGSTWEAAFGAADVAEAFDLRPQLRPL